MHIEKSGFKHFFCSKLPEDDDQLCIFLGVVQPATRCYTKLGR